MKIISLEFEDLRKNWKLKEIEFNQMTLLVGASGVGKTKILKALDLIKSIALGEKLSNIKWKLTFDIEGDIYVWSGQYLETTPLLKVLYKYNVDNLLSVDSLNDIEKQTDNFQSETLIKQTNNNELMELIFKREGDDIFFNDTKAPKLTSNKSCIDLFSSEEEIKLIILNFKKMYFFEFEEERQLGINEVILNSKNVKKDEEKALEVLKNIDIPILVKLATTYKYFGLQFEQIKEEFIEVFPTVEDIRYRIIKNKDEEDLNEYNLEIKEANGNWIGKDDMSSGMLKTLLYISMLYLTPKNSILIIDEFENSLGVNCIDIATETIMDNIGKQFIITSHHPYIINNIGMDKWKIITRKGNTVTGRNASEYKLGKSKHEAFKQLINLKVYAEGSES